MVEFPTLAHQCRLPKPRSSALFQVELRRGPGSDSSASTCSPDRPMPILLRSRLEIRSPGRRARTRRSPRSDCRAIRALLRRRTRPPIAQRSRARGCRRRSSHLVGPHPTPPALNRRKGNTLADLDWFVVRSNAHAWSGSGVSPIPPCRRVRNNQCRCWPGTFSPSFLP